MPKISVVIPLYNKEPHILRALNSVLAQTKPPEEIIVIDDGSTDGGAEVVASLKDSRIRLLRQENRGEGVARNRGIESAQGELIAFLDADDAWQPGFLEAILDLQEKFPQAGIYATAYHVVDRGGLPKQREYNVLPSDRPTGLIANYFLAGFCYPVQMSACAVPRNIAQEVGGFSRNSGLGLDVDFFLKIALRYPIAWTKEPLATYYLNAVNRRAGFIRWHEEPAISQTAREAITAGLVPPDQIGDFKEYIALFQITAIRDCLVLGKKAEALKLLEYSRGTRKFRKEWLKWKFIATLPGNLGPWLWQLKQVPKLFRR